MNIKLRKTADLKHNESNPRYITEENYNKLKKSLIDFPEMLRLRPLVVDDNDVVLGGNMRLRAAKELGIEEVPVLNAGELTEEQKREFIIKDNVGFGEWDWDVLANEWDEVVLDAWGLDLVVHNDEPSDTDLSEKIDEVYRVEVVCTSEEEQEAAYNQITNLGYECRLLTL